MEPEKYQKLGAKRGKGGNIGKPTTAGQNSRTQKEPKSSALKGGKTEPKTHLRKKYGVTRKEEPIPNSKRDAKRVKKRNHKLTQNFDVETKMTD